MKNALRFSCNVWIPSFQDLHNFSAYHGPTLFDIQCGVCIIRLCRPEYLSTHVSFGTSWPLELVVILSIPIATKIKKPCGCSSIYPPKITFLPLMIATIDATTAAKRNLETKGEYNYVWIATKIKKPCGCSSIYPPKITFLPLMIATIDATTAAKRNLETKGEYNYVCLRLRCSVLSPWRTNVGNRKVYYNSQIYHEKSSSAVCSFLSINPTFFASVFPGMWSSNTNELSSDPISTRAYRNESWESFCIGKWN